MKQVVQSPRTGKLELAEVPAPACGAGQVLVRTHYSVVSPGTERQAMDFARRSLVGKARSRPDLVKQVLRKLSHEGPAPTLRAVLTRLDAPQPLGYACAGVVEAAGRDVAGFVPGDRVACAGAGYANHAEWVAVPENLVVRVPDEVPLAKAAFATLGAIALQGVRVAAPALGEIGAVIGLGLLGQLTVQLLRANGCRVLGVDLDPGRVKAARDQGAEWGGRPGDDFEVWKDAATAGHGADFVAVTAASESSEPLALAAELCRQKGRIACVGSTAMHLDRRWLYEKELELRMSMSYGPGRYDRRYEELGLDYPLSYVRWTENRNLDAFLALVRAGAVDPLALEVREEPFAGAERAYEDLAKGELGALALVFRYDASALVTRSVELTRAARSVATPGSGPGSDVGVAFLGAGNYAKGVLLPAVDAAGGVRKVAISTATGPSARRTAERHGFARCTTESGEVLADPSVDLVFVATQHASHAALAARALRAGKAVWLEKPAAITPEQLAELEAALAETRGFLALGFNRRFSPHARRVREAFAARRGPLAIAYTVAAGPTPGGTWHTDPAVGGGRVIGEVCHFVDLCSFLVGASPVSVFATALGRDPETDDSLHAVLRYPDGSSALIQYLAHASAALPKERFEASADGRTAQCDNFRRTTVHGGRGLRTWNQDKGQRSAVHEVLAAVRAGAPSPFAWREVAATTRATFAMLESVRSGAPVALDGLA
jgi:predicted dehydrogenase/threonine dehydrogenase-like Zn-dependent dehydrogenase